MLSAGEIKNITKASCAGYSAVPECESLVQACQDANEGECKTENISDIEVTLSLLRQNTDIARAADKQSANIVEYVSRGLSTISPAAICQGILHSGGGLEYQHCRLFARSVKNYCDSTQECTTEEARGHVTNSLKEAVLLWLDDKNNKDVTPSLQRVFADAAKKEQFLDSIDESSETISAASGHPLAQSSFYIRGIQGIGSSSGGREYVTDSFLFGLGFGIFLQDSDYDYIANSVGVEGTANYLGNNIVAKNVHLVFGPKLMLSGDVSLQINLLAGLQQWQVERGSEHAVYSQGPAFGAALSLGKQVSRYCLGFLQVRSVISPEKSLNVERYGRSSQMVLPGAQSFSLSGGMELDLF